MRSPHKTEHENPEKVRPVDSITAELGAYLGSERGQLFSHIPRFFFGPCRPGVIGAGSERHDGAGKIVAALEAGSPLEMIFYILTAINTLGHDRCEYLIEETRAVIDEGQPVKEIFE